MSKIICSSVGILALIAMVGCSGSDAPTTYKVSGTVTEGGKPVEGALVTFLPSEGQKVAIGSTNAAGEFKLSTFAPSDGAQPGSFKVTVTKFETPPTGSAPPLPPGVLAGGEITESYAPPKPNEGAGTAKTNKNLLPAKYASEATSGLVATVAENNNNTFNFEL